MSINNRRDFIKAMARYTTITALGAAAAGQIYKSLTAPCRFNTTCDHCAKISRCDQPQALEYKKTQGQHGR